MCWPSHVLFIQAGFWQLPGHIGYTTAVEANIPNNNNKRQRARQRFSTHSLQYSKALDTRVAFAGTRPIAAASDQGKKTSFPQCVLSGPARREQSRLLFHHSAVADS